MDSLFKRVDLNGDGKLDRDEFMLIAAVIGGNVGMRVAAQTVLALVLAPWAATTVCHRLAGTAIEALIVGAVPSVLASLACSAVAVTITTSTIVAATVPAALSIIDEYHLLWAAAKMARALADSCGRRRRHPDGRAARSCRAT